MSIPTFYYEPFYSLDEFHHLFDDAFNTRTGGRNAGNAVTQRAGNENAANNVTRPKYVLHLLTVER